MAVVAIGAAFLDGDEVNVAVDAALWWEHLVQWPGESRSFEIFVSLDFKVYSSRVAKQYFSICRFISRRLVATQTSTADVTDGGQGMRPQWHRESRRGPNPGRDGVSDLRANQRISQQAITQAGRRPGDRMD